MLKRNLRGSVDSLSFSAVLCSLIKVAKDCQKNPNHLNKHVRTGIVHYIFTSSKFFQAIQIISFKDKEGVRGKKCNPRATCFVRFFFKQGDYLSEVFDSSLF